MTQVTPKFLDEGLTFDDVLIIPNYSEVLPANVDIQGRFSENIILKAPLVSAAMDTVTESSLAIAMAREGGLGVIHKNMSIEEQAKKVVTVKRAENGMIHDPVTITRHENLGAVKALMAQYKVGGIPVVDSLGRLEGIVTNRDLRFEPDNTRTVESVMTSKDLITAEVNTTLDTASEILQTKKIEKLPITDKQGKLIGLITYKDITKAQDKPMASKDERGRLLVAAGVGVSENTMERVDELVNAQVDAVVIDTAHGHSAYVIDTLKQVRKKYPSLEIVVGNVATAAAAKTLVKAGANGVKVGIGPGSICTTRIIAGVGVPQLTAIYNVAEALKGTNIPLIADGGVRYSGDIVKAFAVGAGSVMLGSLLAGCEEAPGETIIYNGRKFKSYRGMGSLSSMQKGSKDRYFQGGETDTKKLVPEGVEGQVPFTGRVSEVLYQLIGGMKAGMGYAGAPNMEEMSKVQLIRVSPSGMKESHPHNVAITREAPNYSR